MCWTSYSIPVRHIAQEDIKCYKVFDKLNIVWDDSKKIKEVTSLYRKYLYFPYIINPEIIIAHPKHPICDWDYEYFYRIHEGYHSYATLNAAMLYFNKLSNIIECIIPKGSEYYINEDNEIVSSNIIVTDKVIK